MENYHSGDIILISFPFSDAIGAKRRPALVIFDCGGEDVIVARISSQSALNIFMLNFLTGDYPGYCFLR